MKLEKIKTLTDYLLRYGKELTDRIVEKATPLHDLGGEADPKMETLLRKPFIAQQDVIMGLVKVLEKKDSAIVVGEMGSGKSLIGASVPYIYCNGGRSVRTLVMCPGHLVQKWKREVEATIPEVKVIIVRNLKDIMFLHDEPAVPEQYEYIIISKDRAKLSYIWKPALITKAGKVGCYCPDCGVLQVNEDGVPVMAEHFQKTRRKCRKCGSALWQADNKRVRRFAVAEYIKKRLGRHFQFFIADEVHQFKGYQSAQGNAFGGLASACGKTIALTGTILGGYASDVMYILARLSPETFVKEGISYRNQSLFVHRYGVLEKITKTRTDDNTSSKGRRGSTNHKQKPGVSPLIFSRHFMDKTAFLHLEDIALNLPPITEEVISTGMDPLLHEAYKELEGKLLDAVQVALRQGSRHLLGTYLQTLLSYPDRPFGNKPIIATNEFGEEELIAIPKELPQEATYNKEEELTELVKKEKQQGRKVFVFAIFTQKKDVTARLQEKMIEEGIKCEVLRSSVAPEKREDWIAQKVKTRVDCIIANPKLVETGLDLLEFPTMVFYQTGYSIYTLRQASRRSWRIGQDRPVKIYYMYYSGTMQEKALQLMGSKLQASLAIEGKFSDEGLAAMTSGEDMTTLMARALTENLNVESAEDVWRKLNQNNVQHNPAFVEDPIGVPVKPSNGTIQREMPLTVKFDLVTFISKRKSHVETIEVDTKNLEEALEEVKGAVQFSMF